MSVLGQIRSASASVGEGLCVCQVTGASHGLETSGRGAVGLDQDVPGGVREESQERGMGWTMKGLVCHTWARGPLSKRCWRQRGLGLEAKMPHMMHDDTEEYDELKDGEEEAVWPHGGPGLASWRNGYLCFTVSMSLKCQIPRWPSGTLGEKEWEERSQGNPSLLF